MKFKRIKKLTYYTGAILTTGFLFVFIFFPGYIFSAKNNSNAPLLANYFLDWQIDSSTAKELAKWDVLVLDMENQVTSPSQLKLIKELNPDIIILAYISSQEVNINTNGVMHNKVLAGTQSLWYLQDVNGRRLSFWPGALMTASSDTCPKVNGLNWNSYLANFVVNDILSTGMWDGVFFDNAWSHVSWFSDKIDVDRDGQADLNLDSHWQTGKREMFDLIKQKTDNKYLIVGNVKSVLYNQDINGTMVENFNPNKWPEEMGFASSAGSGPGERLVIINANTSNLGYDNFYRLMRFGLTSSLLLNDTYYSFDYGDKDHGQTWWYDEYNVDLGLPAGDAYSLNNYDNFKTDIWRRDYDNGVALVNSTKNKQTIELGGEFEKISGTQDTDVNDGAIVNQVSLDSQDGIVMMKTFQTAKGISFSNGDFLRFYNFDSSRSRNGFFAYEENYPSRTKIYNGDVNGDGLDEKIVITGGRRLEIFNSRGARWVDDFPFGANYREGIEVAVGRLLGRDQDEILVAQSKGPKMVLYNYHGLMLKKGFYPMGYDYQGGFSIAIGNTDGGTHSEAIIGTGPGVPTQILVYDWRLWTLRYSFYPFGKNDKSGVSVGAGNVTGDARDEILAVSTNGSRVDVFNRYQEKVGSVSVSGLFGVGDLKLEASDIDFDGQDEVVVMSR